MAEDAAGRVTMQTAVWALIAAGPLLAFLSYAILSGRGAMARERRLWIERMPRGALTADALLRVTLWLGLTLIAYKGFADLHRVIHGDAGTVQPGWLAGLLLLMAAFSLAMGPAYMAAYLLGWLIPPLRRANRAATAGLTTLGLRFFLSGLLLCALMIPTALGQGLLAALEPWSR
jgi:hypothetical protein